MSFSSILDKSNKNNTALYCTSFPIKTLTNAMYEIKFKQNTKMWKLVWEKQMESFTIPNSLHKTLAKGKGQGAELKKKITFTLKVMKDNIHSTS
jgi:hypothetical protein